MYANLRLFKQPTKHSHPIFQFMPRIGAKAAHDEGKTLLHNHFTFYVLRRLHRKPALGNSLLTHHDAKVPPRWNSLPTHHGSGFRCWTMPILALCFKSPLSAQRLSTFLEGYHPKIHPKTDKKDGIHPHQPTKLAFSASKNTLSRFDNSQFFSEIA